MKRIWQKVSNYPLVTIGLVSANCIVFLLCQLLGDRLYMAGRLTARGIIENKEYGRIIQSMFLHSGLDHLFNNMVILLFLGAMLEKVVGHLPFVISYFASGIGGCGLSLMGKILQDNPAGTIGASGAIFGLNGLLLAVVLLIRYKVPDITPLRVCLMIALSLYSGYAGTNIDNLAHVGGLIVGWIAGLIICMIIKSKDTKKRFRIVQTRGV